MRKALPYLIGTAVLGAGIYGVSKMSGKAQAAKDLKIAFGSLKIGKASLKDGVTLDVVLKATNNSAVELKFTQPFVEISIKNDKGELTPIASSNDAQGIVTLAPRKISELKFNLAISPIQALKIPGLVLHLINNKILVAKGEKPDASKRILLEYGFTAEGINFKEKQDVLV